MDRIMIYEFIGLGSNPNKQLMNLAIQNFFTTLNNGFLKNKKKISVNYSQLIIKLLKQLQKDGFIRYFEIVSVKSHYRIEVYLSNFSKISSFKVLSKVQRRLYSQKLKPRNNDNLNYLYFSNSCSMPTKGFGECLFVIR